MTWFLFVLINQAKYYAQDTGNQYSILGRHSSQLRLIPYLHHTSSVLRYWKYFRNIARNDRWFAHLHIQNGDSKRIWILTYSWTGNFLLAWAGQFSGIIKSNYAPVWTISQNITAVPWKLKVPTQFQIWSVSAIQKHWEEVKNCILHGFQDLKALFLQSPF